MTRDTATLLLALLEEERLALRQGALDSVVTLGAEKQRLAALLDPGDEEPDLIQKIGTAALRNQRLIASAIAGLREAGDRVARIRSGAEGFSAYSRDGSRAAIPTAIQPGFEKRA